jgi:hypothetical protein
MRTGHVSNVRQNQIRNIAANLRLIRRIKKRGCWLCRKKPADLGELHFHHLKPETKKRTIAEMLDYSTAAVVAEIRKCRLLCRKCHCQHHQAKPMVAVVQGGVS